MDTKKGIYIWRALICLFYRAYIVSICKTFALKNALDAPENFSAPQDKPFTHYE